jgi:EAL domain-containing protein (putative c-di-GMP-specific phosphodiesterase class I)
LKKFQSKQSGLSISLSVESKCLESRHFFQELRKALFISKINPEFLQLQVSQEVLNKESSLKQLQEIQELGVKIIINNFGKELTCIESFEKLTVTGVKIDKSFIKDLNKQSPSQTLLTLISLATCFDAKLIAEEIDSELQLLILDKLNVHQAQGSHLYAYANEEQTSALLSTL